jgi:hypothetical protein
VSECATPARTDDPDWAPRRWEEDNSIPNDREEFETWYAELQKVRDRVWVAYCLPQFRVMDWPDEDVGAARKLMARHVCGVCVRADDPGCSSGC